MLNCDCFLLLSPFAGRGITKDQTVLCEKLKNISSHWLVGTMASTSPTNTRRKYSWWWDSHICPKNSKWLQENLSGKLFQRIYGNFLICQTLRPIWILGTEQTVCCSLKLQSILNEKLERGKKPNSTISFMGV